MRDLESYVDGAVDWSTLWGMTPETLAQAYNEKYGTTVTASDVEPFFRAATNT